MKPTAFDAEFGVVPETFKVSDTPQVAPLAVEAAASTARAGVGPFLDGLHKKLEGRLALIPNDALSLDSHLTRWGHGVHCSSMTLCPQSLMKSQEGSFFPPQPQIFFRRLPIAGLMDEAAQATNNGKSSR